MLVTPNGDPVTDGDRVCGASCDWVLFGGTVFAGIGVLDGWAIPVALGVPRDPGVSSGGGLVSMEDDGEG
jgi:hypothetical protein